MRYGKELYPADSALQAKCDWAMDVMSCVLYKSALSLIYPILGFAPAPADWAAANAKAEADLTIFCDKSRAERRVHSK